MWGRLVGNSKTNLEIIKKLGLKYNRITNTGEISVICPLHNDDNPSLSINVNTGKFHCWAGCIKGHSISELVFKLTGETINESGESSWLEQFKRKLDFENIGKYRLPSIPHLPLALCNTGEEYLKTRGFSLKTIMDWNIQWWHEENAIVIPIFKVGYVLRYLSGEKKYKYVSGTKVSETLFGIEKYSDEHHSVVIVEGAFDVLWMHQNGFCNALAVLGSNLSDTQYKLLQGIGKKIYIMMDSDEGGNKACREITKRLRRDFIVKICMLPKGKDPNDCTKTELEEAFNHTKII
jgi:DNA primase